MTAISKNTMTVTIRDVSPTDRRESLIKAIAAAVRWKSHYNEDYKDDDNNLVVLCQLLEALTICE
ncbi:MAG: hypothetical protein ACJ749_18360 [Flavisolibacter sp.]|jgi:hypothetical protein